MTTFTTHTIESSPRESKQLLEKSVKTYGMLPNLHGVLASAPSALAAYQKLHEFFINTSFDAEELTVVWLTINVEHDCLYCVPAHTGIAHSMKVSGELINALINRKPMPNEKLQALQDLTLTIVRNRGYVSDEDLVNFYSVGYEQRQVLEIILGISQKVISNYVNRIAGIEVDDSFKPFVWKKV